MSDWPELGGLIRGGGGRRCLRGLLLAAAVIGGWEAARWGGPRAWAAFRDGRRTPAPPAGVDMTTRRIPEPEQGGAQAFELNAGNAQAMRGVDDPRNERWSDVAGNAYDGAFVRNFSYARPSERGPWVWVRVEPRADTLRGRLEAHGLKPNFAYQMKLCGDFRDRRSFETIGYHGRWRLPGRETNYSDWDYRLHPQKENVEAYLLFDFFVTDARGDAVKDFALDRTLHVLFNSPRQQTPYAALGIRTVRVDCSNPAFYARPKADATMETVWAEPEYTRYPNGFPPVRLPPGTYSAALALTEESFHSWERDGGYWALAMTVPIRFEIVKP